MVCLCLYLFIMGICPCFYIMHTLGHLTAVHKVKDVVHRYFLGNWRLLRESSYIHVSTGIAVVYDSLQLHGDALHWLRFQTKKGLPPILDTCRTVWNGLSFNYNHHQLCSRGWASASSVLFRFFNNIFFMVWGC